MKKLANSLTSTTLQINRIEFKTLSPHEIDSLSVLELTKKEMYDPATRATVVGGPLDLRLGLSRKEGLCNTCGGTVTTCSGHFGSFKLVLPVFHPGFFKKTYVTIQIICKYCSNLLLDPNKKMKYLQVLNESEGFIRSKLVLKVVAECKKAKACFYCKKACGKVKKNNFKIFYNAVVENLNDNGDIVSHSTIEDINPLKALNLFRCIKQEDYVLLGINQSPTDFIIQTMIIPPATIRPSVMMEQENTSNEDDLTIKISEIIHSNYILETSIAKGNSFNQIIEDWDFLQQQVAMLINSNENKGLIQRLKGKHGRFRGNLSGKRVDFTGRTVISPDPNLKINEVGIPLHVAKILTVNEKVTSFNYKKIKNLIIKKEVNFITKSSEMKILVKFFDPNDLKIGDVVERHLMDKDIILFNRQPSLHRLSIMAHNVVIHPHKTFRFNECCCQPYNADFDGDEMNVHSLQTLEARVEASELMNIRSNLISPRSGEPLIAAIQDFITSAYILTSKNTFFTRKEFGYLTNIMLSNHRVSKLPCITRPTELFSGKQVFEVLLDEVCNRNNSKDKGNYRLNLATKTRSFKSKWDINDGYFVIRNNMYLFGRLDKSIIGAENKEYSLLYILIKMNRGMAMDFLNKVAALTSRYLMEYGFSIGLDDVTADLRKEIGMVYKEGYFAINKIISNDASQSIMHTDSFKGFVDLEDSNVLSTNDVQTVDSGGKQRTINPEIENKVTAVLNKIREQCGNICIKNLGSFNSPIVMQNCGSKGSKINISQMIACVGQQIISGKRIPNGFKNRTLPYFVENDKSPLAKGYVKSSFRKGLMPEEFFFHAMSGREGLVDTAVKTAETGYMQRRLMKALEDLKVCNDMSVRSGDDIVQFVYGEDGLDPGLIECVERINYEVIYSDILNEFMSQDLIVQASTDEVLCIKKRMFLPNNMINSEYITEIDRIIESFILAKASTASLAEQHILSDFMEVFMLRFKILIFTKLSEMYIEPGSAVGAIAGQSIGEPGTQMTLKTFHFAGVSSMNITLGVPRIKEIINSVRNISTPIIKATLEKDTTLDTAKNIKHRIDKIELRNIIKSMTEVYTDKGIFLEIEIDKELTDTLSIDIELIKEACITKSSATLSGFATNAKCPPKNSNETSTGTAKPLPKETENYKLLLNFPNYFTMKEYKRMIRSVKISALKRVDRVLIIKDEDVYKLFIEGCGLRDILGMSGIDYKTTTTNNIMEIEEVLGIEAARQSIINEIKYTISSHGISVDIRHFMLLADMMSFKGQVLGITRFGISKMKMSTLMLASFEQTADHLFDAAVANKIDKITNVSESIVLGVPIRLGTGFVDIYQYE